MELREWLIILGLVLVTIIVIDGVRRLQRQRKVPRLDEVPSGASETNEDSGEALDPEEAARRAEINWELPNGGARVVRPAAQTSVEPKPKLQRQEHPGPSKVFARRSRADDAGERSAHRQQARAEPAHSPSPRGAYGGSTSAGEATREDTHGVAHGQARAQETVQEDVQGQADVQESASTTRREPSMRMGTVDEPGNARPGRAAGETPTARDARPADTGSTRGRSGMAAALRSGGQRFSQSMQRMTSALQRHDDTPALHDEHHEPTLGDRDERASASRGESTPAQHDDADGFVFPRFADQRLEPVGSAAPDVDDYPDDERETVANRETPREREMPREDVVTAHPVVEKAQRHHVSAQRARETLAHADEIVVISVMSRNEEGFAGTDLLNLMLACGLRYSEMGIFLRYETEDSESELQFSMVDVVKPGTFDLDTMDDFSTPGVTFLMPLPGARDSAAAFEAMVETAMVIVRNLGGELKDENRSVMTAQTVEFARQRVQEFERRYRLHRSHAN